LIIEMMSQQETLVGGKNLLKQTVARRACRLFADFSAGPVAGCSAAELCKADHQIYP
jgi:hypothetical protein